MSLFSTGNQAAGIYRRARMRAEWRVKAEAADTRWMLPSYELVADGAGYLVHCERIPTVHGAIRHYAEQLGPCRLWIATFAANQATIATLRELRLDPILLVFSRIALTRDVGMLNDAREWAGASRVVTAKTHAKIAVLESTTDGRRFLSCFGSANLSKNGGAELMVLDADPSTARFLVETIERIAASGVEGDSTKRQKKARRR